MIKIRNIHARQILDSRGNPTLEVEINLNDNSFGRAAVPSGASKGEHEAVELRDSGSAYLGKSVFQAIENLKPSGIIHYQLRHVFVILCL